MQFNAKNTISIPTFLAKELPHVVNGEPDDVACLSDNGGSGIKTAMSPPMTDLSPVAMSSIRPVNSAHVLGERIERIRAWKCAHGFRIDKLLIGDGGVAVFRPQGDAAPYFYGLLKWDHREGVFTDTLSGQIFVTGCVQHKVDDGIVEDMKAIILRGPLSFVLIDRYP